MGWAYRARQFWARLTAPWRHLDEGAAQQVLPPAAWALYARMSSGDRQHALQVLERLRAEGAWPDAVEQAALLHDVGKARARLTLMHRTLVVLLQALSPAALLRLAGDGTPAWRRPFYVQAHHAEIGAADCAQAGCPPETVSLVRAHQGADHAALAPEWRSAAAALHRADERS